MSPEREKAVLEAYARGEMSRAVAMEELGLDWYGDLLVLLSTHGVPRPVVGLDDAAHMDASIRALLGGLNELEAYPVLSAIARGRTTASRLDDRVPVPVTAHMPTDGWCMMSDHERAFAQSIGAQERQQKDDNEA